MSAVQLKALLNIAWKVVDYVCQFLQDDHLNLLSDGCIQYSYGARVALVGVVLEEAPEE